MHCEFNYSILMKQKHNKPVKIIQTNNLHKEYWGSMLMPAYPETMEENAIRMISDEIKNIYKRIAMEENIELPDNHYI